MSYFVVIVIVLILLAQLARAMKEKREAREAVDRYMAVSEIPDSAGMEAAEPGGGEAGQEQESPYRQPEHVTASLLGNALTEIGCQPNVDKDGLMHVAYQGESFQVEFTNVYARIWDPAWSTMEANDPQWTTVRDAINAANYGFGPTVVYTAPNEDGIIWIHTRFDIMLHEAIPDASGYVRAMLDTFFSAKERVKDQYQRIRLQQDAPSPKPRRSVGFDTTAPD